jgi:hypothetical protein
MSDTDPPSPARLFLSTARHLTSRQIYTRARRIIRTRWWGLTRRRIKLPRQIALAPHQPLWLPLAHGGRALPSSSSDWSDRLAFAKGVAGGHFRFLGRERWWPDQPDWHDSSVSRLWRYHLHYFDYVLDLGLLAATEARMEAWSAFRRLSESWMACNGRLIGDGWHPYTVSIRIVNFCHALSIFESELRTDRFFADQLLRNTYAQLQYLIRDLEHDVRGNHIIENARALIHGGVVFDGEEAKRWLRVGMKLLESEVAEQIEPDGGHFERTPAYHATVLRNLLEIALVLRRNRSVPAWLDDAIARMLDFLASITRPDGTLPLIKDTTHDGLPPRDLLAAGAIYLNDPRWKRSKERGLYPWCLFGHEGWARFDEMPCRTLEERVRYFESSGFAIIRDKHQLAVIDVGRPCPDYLPAHAHADLLSFELVVDGLPTIVDSGVYEYEAGPWRDFFRSTRAHNTVEVGGANQSEVWASFRVGRRARPRNVRCHRSEQATILQAEHDGYQRLRVPVIHRRTFAFASEALLVIDDLLGEGLTHARSFLHAAPSLQIVQESATVWRMGSSVVSTFGIGSAQVERGERHPMQGWYSERFGNVTPNSVLIMHRSGELPFRLGYVIARQPFMIHTAEEENGSVLNLTSAGQRVTALLPRTGMPRIEIF